MACFAEFRGENEVALKYIIIINQFGLSLIRYRHYQDAYSALVMMFGSVAMLPPRTKRWAEAKVLIDCIDIKVRSDCFMSETAE
jgi:trafficking protein particle complex subunit 11